MARLLRWCLLAMACLLLGVILLWTISRLRGATAAQEAAVAVMQQPWTPAGRNAFAAVWLLQYDVPEAEQSVVAAEDMRRIAEMPAFAESADSGMPAAAVEFRSSAEGRYANLTPSPADKGRLCAARQSGCLRQVRADLPGYEALVDRNRRLLARISALSAYDHYDSELPPRIEAPIPRFDLANASLTQHALAFARGDIDTGLEGVCRDMSTWRRLGANLDSLIMSMIGIAFSTDGHARLLAEMLAETPREHVLPAACPRAVAPATAAESWMCEPMRGEFAFSSNTVSTLATSTRSANPIERATSFLAFDPAMTIAGMAQGFAPICAQRELERVAADQKALEPRLPDGWLRLECASNMAGCILAEIAAPAYDGYLHRAQDKGARLKLLGTLLWLRDRPAGGRSLAARIADRPSALKSPTRDIEIGEDRRSLRIPQFDTARGEYWEIPLPHYLWPGTTGNSD